MRNIPDISGNESKFMRSPGKKDGIYSRISDIDFNRLNSSFGIALHMHQPTIPASCDDLSHAELISNLQHMMEHQQVHDNHNAPVFLWCYWRMSEFVRELSAAGKFPRVMLDYSGNLLWGLKQMGQDEAIEKLKLVTCDKKYFKNVEWLGTMFSHAVASSTPVPDIKLQVNAWRHYFASLFGTEALSRIKGFSPPEMHLPIHPDVCYEYIKTLKECGYEWMMVQEHTIENLDGSGIRRPHFPHKLAARNSLGQVQEIVVLIKTQGSDTKLVAQMQPYYEAKSRGREDYSGKNIPPYVAQISDGENGGVMMNEFPPMYKNVFNEINGEGTAALNGSEYLEFIKARGINENDFITVEPVQQKKIWDCFEGSGEGAADRAIDKVKIKFPGFNLDKGSWTSNMSWVKGYEDVLDPMNKLSVEFHRKFDGKKADTGSQAYKEALLYLLLSQTSCFRYWGSGIWTEYAKEICRRGFEALKK